MLGLALCAIAFAAWAPDAEAKGKKQKAAPAAAKGKGSKKDQSGVVKKDIKKEASLEPKKDFGGPAGSEAATQFNKDATVGERAGPALKIDSFRAKLETKVSSKREEQLKMIENILSVSTDDLEKPNLYFRRGELKFEKSKEFFFKSQEASTKADEQKFMNESKKYQMEAITDYKRVVTDYPGYDRTDEVLYYLGVSLIEVGKNDDASEYYKRLIRDYPQSQYVPDAWLAVGEHFFEKADLEKALKAYQKAEEYTNSTVYGFAVYKQGWCYINKGAWDNAMERFRRVVKYADEQLKGGNKARLSLRKEALKDYVRSYSNVGDGKAAKADFMKVGGKDNYRQMLENLANMYVDQGKHKDVISLCQDLIKDQPESTRNAVFQGRVVEAASRLGNKKYTVKESRELVKIFQKIKKTAAETKDKTKKEEVEKDLAAATEVSEGTVRRLATSYHQEAIKTKNEDLYELAMQLYSDYLLLFPDTSYAYDLRFYYAELLYKLEDFEKAAEQYTLVVEMRPDPEEKDAKKKPRFLFQAAEEAVRSYDNVVVDMDKKNPPKITGIDPVELPALKQKLIKACERYLYYIPKGPRVVEIRYKMARIYYQYNQFEVAAPAFSEIVRTHPKHEVAQYAANLVLDIYNGLKDYEMLEKLAREFYDNKDLGDAEFKKGLRRIIEQTTFKKIELREKNKEYLPAADAYMSFIKEFPESEYVEQSVYNAAVNYDKGGKLDLAIQTRRYMIDKFPKSPLVPTVHYNIAESYERVSDFEKSANEFEQFAQRYPKDKRAQDALFNAGIYRRTLLQYAKANENFNAYLRAYPSATEATQLMFILCEMLEERKDWGRAEACFFDFYKKNKSRDPERWLMSQYKRGFIFREKTKYKKGADEALDDFKRQATKKMKELGKDFKQKMPQVNEGLAQMALDEAQIEFAEYKRMNLKNPENIKAFKKSLEEKSAKAKAVKKTFENIILTYKEAEQTLAALYFMAEVVRDVIRAISETPLPKGLTADQKELYKEELRGQTLPFEEQAIEAYKACVQKANDLGVYNRWSVKALERLHDYRPEEFPLITEMRSKPQVALTLARAPMVTELPKPVVAEPDKPAPDARSKSIAAKSDGKVADGKAADGKATDGKGGEAPIRKVSDKPAPKSHEPPPPPDPVAQEIERKRNEEVKKDESSKESEPD